MINMSLERNASLERALTVAREEFGDEQFGRLFTRGAAMPYEAVVEFALDQVRRAMAETIRADVPVGTATPTASPPVGPCTRNARPVRVTFCRADSWRLRPPVLLFAVNVSLSRSGAPRSAPTVSRGAT
jgi:hypothetical protein